MLFFKGKEDMGLEASLKLLDLPADATIDDANQAYACVHRMIDRFHQHTGARDRGDRQADMDLLTCAYEKAVAYLSGQDLQYTPLALAAQQPPAVDAPQSAGLHFTLNFPAGSDRAANAPPQNLAPLSEPNTQTIEEAISITSRRLRQTESALPDAQQEVESALAAAEAASLRHAKAKQASMNALVTAKSARTRALLLEIEAKRTMDDAIAAAEKARDRVAAARQAASQARNEAGQARKQASRVKNAENTTAAVVICAEDRLEKAKAGLKALTHTLLQARGQMKMFQGPREDHQAHHAGERIPYYPNGLADDRFSSPQVVDPESISRQQTLSDLLQIEASLSARKGKPMPVAVGEAAIPGAAGRASERRQHHRITYPLNKRPVISIDGHAIPVLDLSSAGMCLEAGTAMDRLRIVRGIIVFADRPPVTVTGKVVRKDGYNLGLKLVTRIGNHILDQERLRLSA